jgi:hypothetical protein
VGAVKWYLFGFLYLAYCTCYIAAETTNLWDVEGRFSLKIVSAGNLNVSKDASVSFMGEQLHTWLHGSTGCSYRDRVTLV